MGDFIYQKKKYMGDFRLGTMHVKQHVKGIGHWS